MAKQTTGRGRPQGKAAARKERVRQAHEAAERARRRRTATLSAVGGVVVIVVAMVVIASVNSSGPAGHSSSNAGRSATLAQQVPASVLRSVGAGKGVTPPRALPAGTPPLEQGGKPEVLYIGAEYCPYCAAERWPLVVALGRFGSFERLGGTESAAADVFPRTQTFTFHGARYTSSLVVFDGIETFTNQPAASGGYTKLDTPTPQQQSLLVRYDRAPYTTQPGAIPFLLIGNAYVSIGASYDPSVLQGMSRDQIAAALSDPSSAVAQAVDGAANTLTAAICKATGEQPSSVCSDPSIRKIAGQLPTS